METFYATLTDVRLKPAIEALQRFLDICFKTGSVTWFSEPVLDYTYGDSVVIMFHYRWPDGSMCTQKILLDDIELYSFGGVEHFWLKNDKIILNISPIHYE